MGLAVAFAASSMAVYFIGLMCTHIAAFRTAKNLRSWKICKNINPH